MLTFEQAYKADLRNSLLIGNGFSSRFFNYKNLYDKSGISKINELKKLFSDLDTVDFERVIHHLEGAALVCKAYREEELSNTLTKHSQLIRTELVKAIRESHPAHKEDIEEHFEKSRKFLEKFSTFFTLNYDLLMYWLQLGTYRIKDGFGLGTNHSGNLHGPFIEGAHCNTYNLHGGLHLFLDDYRETHKCIMGKTGVIDEITARIAAGDLPIYVAEGSSKAKMAKINSIPYLRHCYTTLSKLEGNLYIFGHSASENDRHIYDAIFSSNLEHVYFGVYDTSDENISAMEAQMASHSARHKKKVGYTLYDSKTVDLWAT